MADFSEVYYSFQDKTLEKPQLTTISSSTLPDDVQSYLQETDVTWDALPGLLQRATLWEHGYVYHSSTAKWIKVYTKCGDSIATIAVSKEESSLSEATGLLQCGMRFRAEVSRRSPPFHSVIKCAVDPIEAASSASTGAVWAEGTPNDVPSPQVVQYSGTGWKIAAIHATESTLKAGCNGVTTVVIPCVEYDGGGWCRPQVRPALRQRLLAYQKTTETTNQPTPAPSTSTNSSNTTLYLAIGGGISLALVVLLLLFCLWKRQQTKRTSRSFRDDVELHSIPHPPHHQTPYHPHPPPPRSPIKASHDDQRPTDLLDTMTVDGTYRPSLDSKMTSATAERSIEDACRQSDVLADFFFSSTVAIRRLDFHLLSFLRILARGTYGEIWLGTLEQQHVAIKRLVPSKAMHVQELEQFSLEIALLCKFEHPNINHFYGVAWNHLHELCIVTAYAQHGDLGSFLKSKSPRELPWRAGEKLQIAIDMAEALVYLHSLAPIVIHRDLKSKNVLIHHDLSAKLIDFGTSRERSVYDEETMTAAVGTVRWTAPEVLRGSQYNEKADIYALGTILTELDTHLLPYATQVNANGDRLGDVEIAMLVLGNQLRPAFTAGCPRLVMELGEQCMHHDPALRPTAMEIAYRLRSIIRPAVCTV